MAVEGGGLCDGLHLVALLAFYRGEDGRESDDRPRLLGHIHQELQAANVPIMTAADAWAGGVPCGFLLRLHA
jgi:hypothetical protein